MIRLVTKRSRLALSLIIHHAVFGVYVLLWNPWTSEYYQDQDGLIVRELVLTYGFFIIPYVLWHAGDALRSGNVTDKTIFWLLRYRFALLVFGAQSVWWLAWAAGLVGVPGAHETETLNAYSGLISVLLYGIACTVGFAKLVAGIVFLLKVTILGSQSGQ